MEEADVVAVDEPADEVAVGDVAGDEVDAVVHPIGADLRQRRVGQHEGVDQRDAVVANGELAQLEQPAGEAHAQETQASGDDHFHRVSRPAVPGAYVSGPGPARSASMKNSLVCCPARGTP